jgi:hypothetical protein
VISRVEAIPPFHLSGTSRLAASDGSQLKKYHYPAVSEEMHKMSSFQRLRYGWEFMRLLHRKRASRRWPLASLHFLFRRPATEVSAAVLLWGVLAFASGCGPSHLSKKPSVQFTQIPGAVPIGGPEELQRIAGRVTDGGSGAQVVVFARSEGTWWVQPYRSHSFTEVTDDGSWSNVTHLGTEYAALLVTKGYQPPAKVSELPQVNNSVLAVATTNGTSQKPAESSVIHFSGYDWKVRSGIGDADGEPCDYEASNVWVDDQGYLHLLMGHEAGQYLCGGVSLARSLGYGTYRFQVSDSAHLPPSAIFLMLVRSDRADPDDLTGFTIELTKWGRISEQDAAFTVQPYYIPGNTMRFTAPAGPATYVLRWEPGSAIFDGFSGVMAKPHRDGMHHVFDSDIPIPSTETVKLDFHDFHHSHSGVRHPVEIVVQKFEYLP